MPHYNEILGKGASKTVYKAFDEFEGIEVAWNQVKLHHFLHRPEDLERLYCEIHLLKTLKHENIMKFYTSWVDTANRNINFVTEMFTSGTLRQYRMRHKRANIRAVKLWCRQILKGLHYLHSHDPPVIHRDLKCDNIFVNGNQGEVKIGDLGLAAILEKSHASRCVGTPEFMAPEIYEEEYNELVDIYSFGMCVLEMVTFEYPYSECTHPAQIYKKVVSGQKPDALYKVLDPEVRQFVEKCLAAMSYRLSARELMKEPFLQSHDDYGSDSWPLEYQRDVNEIGCLALERQPLYGIHEHSNLIRGYADYLGYYPNDEKDYYSVELDANEFDLLHCQEEEHLEGVDIAIKGKRREDDGIFFRLRIADEEGRIRNIYFSFDTEADTALSVAAEMVAELDVSDQDVSKIAEMIDGEIASLVPGWKTGFGSDEIRSCSFVSTSYLLSNASSHGPGTDKLKVLASSGHGSAAAHSRFEEITYQLEGLEQNAVRTSLSNASNYTDIWAQKEIPELYLQGSEDIHSEGHSGVEQLLDVKEERSSCSNSSMSNARWDDHGNEIRQELRWLKAKYQIQLTELKDQKLRGELKSPSPECDSDNSPQVKQIRKTRPSNLPKPKKAPTGEFLSSYLHYGSEEKRCANSANRRVQHNDALSGKLIITAKDVYAETLLPNSLHRASSLPVDAVEF